MTSTPSVPQLIDTLSVVESVLHRLGRRLPAHVSREDLASVGKVALIEALLRFTGPDGEARAYCYTRVRGAMLDELRRLDPLARRTRTRVKTVARATAHLTGRLGREPADFEVAAATGLTIGAVHEANRFTVVDPLPLNGEADGTRYELRDLSAPCPAETAANGDTALSVRAALARLPPKQALAVRRYHLEDATLYAIAHELSVSRERARQIREAGEKQLRADFIVLALWQSLMARR
jgi:RNA polymerase sigma factor for flagellar operon FliA